MKSQYTYLLLDWDGCLAMSLQNALEVYREVFPKHGLQVSDEDIVNKAFGDWNPAAKFPLKDNNAFINDVVYGIHSRMAHVKLYPEVKETLIALKENGKKLAIVTSSKRETVLPAIKNLQIEHVFDCFLGKEDFIHEKPDPELLLKAMEKIGAVKDETLIIGDSYKDVGAGKNAGITTVVFFPKENEVFYKIEDIKKIQPDYIIKNFNELIGITL